MTDEQKALLRDVGASLKHVGGALAESFNHAQHHGSKTPLQPLDECLGREIPNLRRAGQGGIAAALASLRIELGE